MAIDIQGLAASDPVPGLYAQVNFAQGQSAGFGGSRNVLLMGNKTSAGSATTNTVVYGPDTGTVMANEADCISLFGAGSEIHRMYRRFARVNPSVSVYAIAVTESGGTAASKVHTLSGTATAPGVVRVWVGDERVDYGFSTGDTASTIAGLVDDTINTQTQWPLTANTSGAAITSTAKLKGPRGNWIRMRYEILPSPTATGISVDVTGSNFLASGATADSNTTALSTILSTNFYYIVSAANDSTQFGALATQVGSQAQPINGNRQRCFCGTSDSAANAITLAVAINNARAEVIWLANSDATPEEQAAAAVAVYSLEEASVIPRLNFNFYGQNANNQSLWTIRAPLDGSKPTRAQIKSALQNGVTPIQVLKGGRTCIESRITSYSLNGSVNDYRVRPAGKVTVCDFYMDDLIAIVSPAIDGKNIGGDPVGQEAVPPNVFTPRDLKAIANKLTRDYGDKGLLDSVAQIITNTLCVRESNPTDRMDIQIPLFVRDILNQVGMRVDQVG